jgi:hypothetical protein
MRFTDFDYSRTSNSRLPVRREARVSFDTVIRPWSEINLPISVK